MIEQNTLTSLYPVPSCPLPTIYFISTQREKTFIFANVIIEPHLYLALFHLAEDSNWARSLLLSSTSSHSIPSWSSTSQSSSLGASWRMSRVEQHRMALLSLSITYKLEKSYYCRKINLGQITHFIIFEK